MCGICGYYGELAHHIGKSGLEKMLMCIEHRGPDSEGIFCENDIGIGMRRLSIIDIEGGFQPIHNENKEIWVIFNGEIYNYKDLRKDLMGRGHKFYTEGDTEVIVHLYEEYGENFVNYLVGMFAIAIYDKRSKKMVLIRDRMGIKPLYYSIENNTLIFASEIKSLLTTKVIKREVAKNLIGTYLLYRYIPGEQTMFENIYKLMPGYILIYKDSNVKVEQYWDIEFQNNIEQKTEEFYTNNIVSLVNQSIRCRLESGVPTGIFLSGGLDSSIILSEIAKINKSDIKTFSIAFEKPRGETKANDYSELKYARSVANKFSTSHYESIIKIKDVIGDLNKIVWHLDEPIGDPTAIPLFYLSEFAKDYVSVVFSGEGADEIFAGYKIYNEPRSVHRYNRIPKIVREKLLEPALTLMGLDYGKDFIRRSKLPISKRYSGVGSTFREFEIARLINDDLKEEVFNSTVDKYIESIFEKAFMSKDEVNQMLYFDQKVWLPEDTLIKSDKISMANSLELRVPFLDHRLVEFASSIPSGLKYKGSCEKYILKQAYKDDIPEIIINRKKNGFPMPITSLLSNEYYEYVRDILLSPTTLNRGYFKKSEIEQLLRNKDIKGNFKGRQIWLLLSFELWNRTFIDYNGEANMGMIID